MLPPTYLFLSIVFMVILHVVLPGAIFVQGLCRLFGLLPLALGMMLNLAADRSLKKHQTTVKPFDRSRRLITNGVFRLSRNPMYLGMTLILLGITLGLGSASPFVIVILFMLLMQRIFILPEERKMEQEFGAVFGHYKQAVRRWI